ncbi:uncharacterized protein [Nicotiana tomentosiformis]|uniref:uncharacterized protein n=1 Tax=Nicotiana tomentosiformis TaxID=4098 RepID=UPI00051BA5FC|nr:uncharacterized protein LOC104111858 [Nicotiana tomentosiformis]
MMLPRVPDNWATMAFASNLNEKSSEATRRLKESLWEFPATTWNNVYNRYSTKLIADYRLLQGEVEYLLKQGYLTYLFSEKGKQFYMKNMQEPSMPPSPKRMVNVITGREKVNGVTYTAMKKTSKVTFTHGKRVCLVLEGDNIVFDDEDADDLMIPHNDALVISLLIYDTNVKRVLIDPGSSMNIILLKVVNEMQANNRIIPKARSISVSDNSSVIKKGEIVLVTFAESVIKDTKFQVIGTDIAYNIILGRPWIHYVDDVPSTLHQVIKFPYSGGFNKSGEINRPHEILIQW